MLIYLDLCCFNRPWDDQSSARVRLETEAKLLLQERVRSKQTALVWSYVLSYENDFNPFRERRESIQPWQALASTIISPSDTIATFAESLVARGATAFDALHVACAHEASASIFVTTDDRLRRLLQRENIINALLPQEALAALEHWYEN
jgi:predicted nucleic acid-binding protein